MNPITIIFILSIILGTVTIALWICIHTIAKNKKYIKNRNEQDGIALKLFEERHKLALTNNAKFYEERIFKLTSEAELNKSEINNLMELVNIADDRLKEELSNMREHYEKQALNSISKKDLEDYCKQAYREAKGNTIGFKDWFKEFKANL